MEHEIQEFDSHYWNQKYRVLLFSTLLLQEQPDSSQGPLGRLLLGLQVEGPDEGRSSLLRLVHRALVDVSHVRFVHRYGTGEDHRHDGGQFFEPGVSDHTRLRVPTRSFHVQAVDVGALSRRAVEVLLVLLGDVALQAHLVQRPLVLARHRLHDGGEEALRVEEAAQPDGGGHGEVGGPALQLLDTQQEIAVPDAEGVETRVGAFCPGFGQLVQEQGVS